MHPANIRDADGAKLALAGLRDDAPAVTKIWADLGYRGPLATWMRTELACELTIVARPRTAQWVRVDAAPPPAPPVPAFPVLPRRWVVERTFGWFGRFRRLSKDYEGLAVTEEAWIQLAMSRLMLRRLAA